MRPPSVLRDSIRSSSSRWGTPSCARRSLGTLADAAARCIVVGDADAWAANWSIAALVREEATIVVHGGPREYRTLASGPALPPLLDDAATQCWVIDPAAAGAAGRVAAEIVSASRPDN